MRNTTYSVCDLRMQLLKNGYVPLANESKACFLKGWPSIEVDEAEIERWSRRHKRFTATGVRIENGLVAIDVDIDHDIAFALLTDIDADALFPWALEAPLRHSGGNKFALFVRCNERFSRLHSRRWTPPGQSADDGTCLVEIFGGGSPRQFGCFGPHTIIDGEVVKSYEWDGASLLDTALGDLPLVDKADLFAFIDAVEAHLAENGFEPVKLTQTGETAPERVYDLAGDAFVTHEHGTVTLGGLRALVEAQDSVYLSASWLDGPVARNTRRCLASVTHSGALSVWDSMTGLTHLEADRDPGTADRAFDLDRAAEQLKELEARERGKIGRKDDCFDVAAKLLEAWAFCPTQQTSVVPIWARTSDDGITLSNFRTMMLPWCMEEVGKYGGVKKINPVDLWASSVKRITVQGLRLRPDMPRPLYEEGGQTWINTYAPPIHDAAPQGLADFLTFMSHLIPGEAEREWFLDWLAHKYQNPAVPGQGVVMVARKQGAGRGTLFALMQQLFGEDYANKVDGATLTGEGSQAQYNTFLANSLVVMVDELFNAGTGAHLWQRKKAYERIKGLIDPASRKVEIIRKTLNNFTTRTYASFLMATNNVNALPLDENDRRIAVLANGGPLIGSREAAQAIGRWREGAEFKPGFVSAVAGFLAARALTRFDPYGTPPMTEAKATMINANATDVSEAVDAVLMELPGDYLTRSALVERVKFHLGANASEHKNLVQEARDRLDQSDWVFLGRVRYNEKQNKADIWARSEEAAKVWHDTNRNEREALLEPNNDVLQKATSTALLALEKGFRVVKD